MLIPPVVDCLGSLVENIVHIHVAVFFSGFKIKTTSKMWLTEEEKFLLIYCSDELYLGSWGIYSRLKLYVFVKWNEFSTKFWKSRCYDMNSYLYASAYFLDCSSGPHGTSLAHHVYCTTSMLRPVQKQRCCKTRHSKSYINTLSTCELVKGYAYRKQSTFRK